MAKVTYLMGAGASYHSLPTYQNFSKRFSLFRHFIAVFTQPGFESIIGDITEILASCDNVLDQFEFHSTPDTIAKKYFHQQELKKLSELKTVLILFFLYEQTQDSHSFKETYWNLNKSRIDKRYDSFIASILAPTYSKISIERNFNILTWNYDLQFEICFKNYLQKEFTEVQLALQSLPSIKTIADNFAHNSSEFSIVHLNGIAFSQKINDPICPLGNTFDKNSLIFEIVDHYRLLKNGINTEFDYKGFLNFAWERSEGFPGKKHILEKTLNGAFTISDMTEILVIIGYSFPIFNRAVDVDIIKRMSNLKTVYIQSPNAQLQKEIFIEIFRGVNPHVHENSVKAINALDYFHIPFEWNDPIKEFIPAVA